MVIFQNTMRKTIIALYGRANEGKSSTLINLYNLMGGETTTNINDISISLIYQDNKIAFISQSDPTEEIFETFEFDLRTFLTNNCKIVFVTSRTRGKIVHLIDELANEFNYNVIWLSTSFSPHLNTTILNDLHANYLLDLSNTLIFNQNIH